MMWKNRMYSPAHLGQQKNAWQDTQNGCQKSRGT